VAPHEALDVLYRTMRDESHRRIHMAIETASELRVFFIIVN
jgi:hypothetical protein